MASSRERFAGLREADIKNAERKTTKKFKKASKAMLVEYLRENKTNQELASVLV